MNRDKNRKFIFILAGWLLISISATANSNNSGSSMSAKINQDFNFSQLDLSFVSGKNSGSPVVTEKQIFDGLTDIFFNVPRKISLKDVSEIKVCLLSILKINVNMGIDKYVSEVIEIRV